MKKLTQFTLLLFCSIGNVSYGQFTDEINSDFLRNYKAPDFKFRRFDVQLNGSGMNTTAFSGVSNYYLNQLSALSYQQYANSQRYQGTFYAGVSSSINRTKNLATDQFVFGLGSATSSRNYFYIRPNFFIGAHHNLGFISRSARVNKSFSSSQVVIFGTEVISAGFGRLEPIQYARNAMDIQRSLTKGGRLASPYSLEELTILSDEIARLNNVRFYDFRLRRIEQFEALDKTMQSLGRVSDFDMTYFAYLADAYLYAQSFARFSGFRQEFGLAANTDYNRYKNDDPFDIGSSSSSSFGSLFYNAIYELPVSYKMQHTLEALATISYDSDGVSQVFSDHLVGHVSSRYTLGFYPTTRTNYNVGAFAGASIGNDFGYSAGLFANGYIYLSPQFRLGGDIMTSYGDGYINNPLQRIWRDNGSSINDFYITGRITLNYAIF